MKCEKCGKDKISLGGRSVHSLIWYCHDCERRLEMRNTPEGQFLWKIGFDYYDTETSARCVAEFAIEEIEKLRKINKELQDKLLAIETSS